MTGAGNVGHKRPINSSEEDARRVASLARITRKGCLQRRCYKGGTLRCEQEEKKHRT